MYPPVYNPKALNAVVKLVARKSKNSDLLDFMENHSKETIGLDTLRRRLTKIEGPLAEGVIQNREDRL
jgi:AAA15 family ATPase/GTPase